MTDRTRVADADRDMLNGIRCRCVWDDDKEILAGLYREACAARDEYHLEQMGWNWDSFAAGLMFGVVLSVVVYFGHRLMGY
jgi:hypothetical protein